MLQHPSLEAAEIHDLTTSSVYRRRVPGKGLNLTSVASSVPLRYLRQTLDLSRLEQLKLERPSFSDAEIFQNCRFLVNLELTSVSIFLEFPAGTFPSTLERLEIRYMAQSIFLDKLLPRRPAESPFVQYFCDHIRSLPRLRKLVLSEPDLISFRHMEVSLRPFYDSQSAPFAVQGEDDGAPRHPLIELCRERGIEFIVGFGERSITLC